MKNNNKKQVVSIHKLSAEDQVAEARDALETAKRSLTLAEARFMKEVGVGEQRLSCDGRRWSHVAGVLASLIDDESRMEVVLADEGIEWVRLDRAAAMRGALEDAGLDVPQKLAGGRRAHVKGG